MADEHSFRDVERVVLEHLAQRDLLIGERLELVRERADDLKAAVANLHAAMTQQQAALEARLRDVEVRTDKRLRMIEIAAGQTPRSRQGDLARDWRTILYGIGAIAVGMWAVIQAIWWVGEALKGFGLR